MLARVPVFEELADEDLRRVADVSVPRRFGAGEVVFREGDDSDTCYVVHAGHARAIREHPDGRSITLATFGPGDIFGELAMFDDERRSATVEASDDLEVLGILGGDMRQLMRRHPDIAVKLVIALGRRLRAANERLARQSFQTVQSRVAAVLAQLVDQAHAEGGPERDVPVVATQADLAKLAGSSRESASRFLAVLERAGVITQGRGRLTVHDPAGAAGLCLLTAGRAGDLLRRCRDPRDEVLVITPVGKRRVTGLPKGGANPGESGEETAAREVREETGVTATVREPLGDVNYWYRRGGRRVYKTVHFYLFDFVSGSTDDHDHEVEEARWIPLAEARDGAELPGRAGADRARIVQVRPRPLAVY